MAPQVLQTQYEVVENFSVKVQICFNFCLCYWFSFSPHNMFTSYIYNLLSDAVFSFVIGVLQYVQICFSLFRICKPFFSLPDGVPKATSHGRILP